MMIEQKQQTVKPFALLTVLEEADREKETIEEMAKKKKKKRETFKMQFQV